MKPIYFGKKKVQKPGRIVLDEPLLRNACLDFGDEVVLLFDPITKNIILAKDDEAATSGNVG